MSYFDPLDYGAKADGEKVDTAACQAAIDAAYANGGGTVIFRSGKQVLAGSLILKDNVWIHMEPGSTLKCSGDWEDITERFDEGWVNTGCPGSGKFISTKEGTVNVGITGSGTINGSGLLYMKSSEFALDSYDPYRPFLLFLIGVKGVTIRDVTLKDSAFWNLRVSACEDVILHGVRVRGDLRIKNCDGIDIDACKRVRISDCDVSCPDDAISIKACREFQSYGACEDIVITNCILESRSSAIVVGVDAMQPIRNVTCTNCVIRNSHRGLSVNLGEGADFENILFSDMIVETRVYKNWWWGAGEPIYVSVAPWVKDVIGACRNIRFRNILCRSECGAFIHAEKLGLASDIVLENVKLDLSVWAGQVEPRYDYRPTYEGDYAGMVDIPKEGIAGIHLENVKDVVIKGCEVRWSTNPDSRYSNAIWARGCEDVKVVDFEGKAAKAGIAAIDMM